MRRVGLVLLWVATVTPAHAFVLPNPFGSDKAPHESPMYMHWDMRQLPGCGLPWSMCGAGTADLAGTSEFDGIPASFDAWASDACGLLSFVQKPANPPTCQVWFDDKWNLVYWDARPDLFVALGYTPGSAADSTGNIRVGTPAVTFIWFTSPSGVISNADVILNETPNKNFTWVNAADGAAVNWKEPGFYGPPSAFQADVRTLVTHEAGHFLGLSHNSVAGSIMNVEGLISGGVAQHGLADDDRDGKSFLYCMDLGDAPDPCGAIDGEYPSRVHYVGIGDSLNGIRLDGIRHGAVHYFGIRPRQPNRNYTYEWMGGAPGAKTSDMSAECNPRLVDKDDDDGVSFLPDPPVAGKPVKVRVHVTHARDAAGQRHDYLGDDILHVNAWADLNRDCYWSPATEHFMHDSFEPDPPPPGPNTTIRYRRQGQFTMPGGGSETPLKPVWVRVRLDWREDVGAVQKWDPWLNGVYGGAQVGEVEDYKLIPVDYNENRWSRNSTGNQRLGMGMVSAGAASAGGVAWAASVDSGDCVNSPVPPEGLVLTYDGLRDETTLEAKPRLPVPSGEWFHLGRSQYEASNPNPPLAVLRAFWIPASGPPGPLDWIPGTHAGISPGTLDRPALLRVGCTDDGTGGVMRADSSGDFLDSMDVSVGWRISPAPVPVPNLSACDPMVRDLPETSAGSARITPEAPFVFEMPAVRRGESLILRVRSRWSVNANEGEELIQFLDPVDHIVGVSPPGPAAGMRPSAIPNPFSSRTTITFVQSAAGLVSAAVFDVSGARVRTLARGSWALAGPRALEWDGRDERGATVPGGVYFVRIRSLAGESSLRLVRIP